MPRLAPVTNADLVSTEPLLPAAMRCGACVAGTAGSDGADDAADGRRPRDSANGRGAGDHRSGDQRDDDPRERNPHVPVSSPEIVATALRCIDAGASIVHTHAVDVSGLSRVLLAAGPRGAAGTRRLYPTQQNRAPRWRSGLAHYGPLAADGGMRIGMVEPGVRQRDVGRPGRLARARAGPVRERHRRRPATRSNCCAGGSGSRRSASIYEPTWLNHTLAFHRAGRLPPRAPCSSCTSAARTATSHVGGGVSFGLPPTAKGARRLSRDDRPRVRPAPAVVRVGHRRRSSSATPVARLALEAGGHLKVGLEDHAAHRGAVQQKRSSSRGGVARRRCGAWRRHPDGRGAHPRVADLNSRCASRRDDGSAAPGPQPASDHSAAPGSSRCRFHPCGMMPGAGSDVGSCSRQRVAASVAVLASRQRRTGGTSQWPSIVSSQSIPLRAFRRGSPIGSTWRSSSRSGTSRTRPRNGDGCSPNCSARSSSSWPQRAAG